MASRIEQDLQKHTINALRMLYPAGVVFHIPNGGKRGKIEAAIMKGMGVVAGVPDLCVVRPFGSVSWIEMKASKDEKPSKAQDDFHAALRQRGHDVSVVYDLSQLEPLVRRWKHEDIQVQNWNPERKAP
jgi:hypothetical protein